MIKSSRRQKGDHLTTSTQHTPRPSSQRGGILSLLFLVLLIAGLAVFAVYAYGLSRTITEKFENRRWDIPARVYSRPLILEENASLTKSDLDAWLKLLHYSKNDNQNSGTYTVNGNTYTISTRGFDYGDEDSDSTQIIEVRFSNGRISSLKSSVPTTKGFVRLEPVNIGSIYPDSNEDRLLIQLKDTPQPLIDALIATEDRGFYEHHGISVRGTTRAILNNFKGGGLQGGSTLTQQLIKNFYLNSERSLKRKANEAIMALLLEQRYSKDDILQAYLNEINLGQNGNQSINGFGIASQFYFNKPLAELRLDQYALLVGIAKGSSFYNPRKHPERALARRNVVLKNMLDTGKISQEDYAAAIAADLDVVETPTIAKSRFPDFLDYTRRELGQRYKNEDLKTAGLRVITTLDPLAQMAADQAFKQELAKLQRRNKASRALQGALVSADPRTGEVVALVGSGSDFTGFNRAIDAKRQVGSLLKPVIYLMALQSGEFNLASGVDDSEKTYKNWTPKNYDGTSHGTVALTTALANSYNQAAVNTGMVYGVTHFTGYLKQLGINAEIPDYPATMLGAVDLSPMQMLGMYQIFASGGVERPLHSIESVIDEKGRLLQKSRIKEAPRIPEDAAYLLNFALQSVIKDGTAKSAQSLGANLGLAGKTGTTNDARDAWFAGYSGNYVSVVWVGRDDNKPISLTGGSGALPIWTAYMKRLKLTPVKLPTPKGIEWGYLELGTGRATTEDCAGAAHMPYKPDSVKDEPSLCQLEAIETARQAALLAQYGENAASLEPEEDPSDISETAAPEPEPNQPTEKENPPTEKENLE